MDRVSIVRLLRATASGRGRREDNPFASRGVDRESAALPLERGDTCLKTRKGVHLLVPVLNSVSQVADVPLEAANVSLEAADISLKAADISLEVVDISLEAMDISLKAANISLKRLYVGAVLANR
jgi:hypothetical protein